MIIYRTQTKRQYFSIITLNMDSCRDFDVTMGSQPTDMRSSLMLTLIINAQHPSFILNQTRGIETTKMCLSSQNGGVLY